MAYDNIYRLVNEKSTEGSAVSNTGYEYDKSHNRIRKVKDGVVTTYSRNSLNQLTKYTEGSKQIGFKYDLNGNRTQRIDGSNVTRYYYDDENRLTGVDKDGVKYRYTYDYRTRRVERKEGSQVTKVVFSGGTSVQEFDNNSSSPIVQYVRGSDYGGGIGGILYSVRSSGATFNHYNRRGDVVGKTDGSGNITWQSSYEAFGTRTQETGSNLDRQRANTKEEDPTGLLNEGFRYRDLETGEFITRDPAGFVDGPNLYAYVVQNPWTKWDPEGLSETWSDMVNNQVQSVQNYYEGNSNNWFTQGVAALIVTGTKVLGGTLTAGESFATNTGEWAATGDSSKAPIVGPAGTRLGEAAEGFSRDPSFKSGVEMVGAVSEGTLAVLAPIQIKRGFEGKTGSSEINQKSPSSSSERGSPSGSATESSPVAPGDRGTYSELVNRKRVAGETEQMDMDHRPSFAAQVEAAQRAKGGPLTKEEMTKLKNESPAVATPRKAHQVQSRTYGGRNTKEKINQDADDLAVAAEKDDAAYKD